MLLLKLLLVPALIALITLAGRRWGPAVAGWLAGFPVVAGPILLMIGVEQGPLFAAQGAQSALTAVLANLAFSIGYSWSALRWPWYVCLPVGVLAFALAGMLLSVVALPLWGAVALTAAGLGMAPRAFPKRQFTAPPARPSPLELPARMLAGAVLTVLVTVFAQRLGPAVSGLFAVFPVMSLVFGIFSHIEWGAAGAIRLLSGMVHGLYAFVVFCPVVAIAVPRLGLWLGFTAALLCALLIQASTFRRRA
jgi:hypothetical protein